VASIEDQFRICREHAGREAWQVVDTYQDAAISGASRMSRIICGALPPAVQAASEAAVQPVFCEISFR
jgi:hypothetical protein